MSKEKKKLPLAAYIFAGLVLGILAGAALMKTPEIAVEYIKPFGTLFLNLVKFIVVPIVLFSIMSGKIIETILFVFANDSGFLKFPQQSQLACRR